MRTSNGLIALAALAALLAGCRAQPHMNPDFGNSMALNKTQQIIDPGASATAASRPASTLDGQKTEKALERYRKDRPDESRQKLVKDIN